MTRNYEGLTLPELVIAMAVTSIIGVAVAGVAATISSANASAEDYGDSVTIVRMAVDRVNQEIRKSALVVCSDAQRIVLWTGDANNSGYVNYNELSVLKYDPSAGTLTRYRVVFDEPWQVDYYNYTFWLSELADPTTVESWVRCSSFCRTTVLATGVTGFSGSLSPAPPLTKVVTLGVAVGEGNEAMAVESTASLRADWTGHVYESWGQYYLDTE